MTKESYIIIALIIIMFLAAYGIALIKGDVSFSPTVTQATEITLEYNY